MRGRKPRQLGGLLFLLSGVPIWEGSDACHPPPVGPAPAKKRPIVGRSKRGEGNIFREGTAIGCLFQRDQQRDVEIDGRGLKSRFCASLVWHYSLHFQHQNSYRPSSTVEMHLKCPITVVIVLPLAGCLAQVLARSGDKSGISILSLGAEVLILRRFLLFDNLQLIEQRLVADL
jgi:hypothetical protein